jgi:hypothetical protein
VDHRDKRGDDTRYAEADWIASLSLAMTLAGSITPSWM